MKLSKLMGQRVKEAPNGANLKSHILLLRAGYIKQVSAGIFSLLPPAQRVSLKIQNIIRQEMDALGGQEVLFPVVMPRELWEMSGRYGSIKSEMVRFKDRAGHDMVLGMTHEEAAVFTAMNTVTSHEQLPFMVYQLQTKFRDEPRARGGLIRVREFTMKDAYSFHATQEDLDAFYKKMYDAYVRIYKRIGFKKFTVVEGDNGMMGGKVSHEYMAVTDAGEDRLVICPKCGYSSNMEVAVSLKDDCTKNCYEKDCRAKDCCEKDCYAKEDFPQANCPKENVPQGNCTQENCSEKWSNEHQLENCGQSKSLDDCGAMEEVFTGNAHTIDEVCAFLEVDKSHTAKAVCYQTTDGRLVVAFLRGDYDVNECKLQKIAKSELLPVDVAQFGLDAGNIGCVNLNVPQGTVVAFDKTLQNLCGFVTGANKKDFHLKNVCAPRDLLGVNFVDIANVKEGDRCVHCGEKLSFTRGIEIGNIFQLGTKYTATMGMKVTMPDGTAKEPIMGCYGIGVGRCLASVIEEKGDEKGLVWPMTIAPWQVHFCPLRMDNETVSAVAGEVYKSLCDAGIEVLYDDRNTSAGVKLTDSELMGMPIRVVISPKTLAQGQAEVTMRESGEQFFLNLSDLVSELKLIIKDEIAEIEKS